MSKSNRSTALWTAHLVVFVGAQLVFALTGESWPVAFLDDRVPEQQSIPMIVSRVWLIVFVADTVWSWWSIGNAKREERARQRSVGHPLVTRRDVHR